MANHKPGPGWKCTGAIKCVWDHSSGMRIHTYGIIVFADGHEVNGRVWPEIQSLERFIRIAGGNRRRGTMIWALRKLAEQRSDP